MALEVMKKKQSRRPPNQAELPLGSSEEEEATADSQARVPSPAHTSPLAGRDTRRYGSTVFEFEESSQGGVARGGSDGTSEAEADEPDRDQEEVVFHERDSSDRSEAERLFEDAKSASRAGRIGEAISLYRRIVAMDPTHVRARNNLGVLFDQSGNHEVALEHFEDAIGQDPENAEILTNLGAALAAQGRYDEAEVHLRRAARLDPGGLDVRANLGILYFRRGLYGQADQELRWVCDHDADHTLAHFYRGEALNRLGRVDEALEVLERASHLQPNRARVYYLMGILYDKKNLRHEAGVMYRKARALTDR